MFAALHDYKPFLNKRYLSKHYALSRERDTSHSLEKRAEHLGVCRRREGNLFYCHVRSRAFPRASVYFLLFPGKVHLKNKKNFIGSYVERRWNIVCAVTLSWCFFPCKSNVFHWWYIRKMVTVNDISRATFHIVNSAVSWRSRVAGHLMLPNNESWRISLFQPQQRRGKWGLQLPTTRTCSSSPTFTSSSRARVVETASGGGGTESLL